MAIKSSGTISLGTTAGTDGCISGELGGTQPHALSEYYRDGSYSDGIFIPASQTSVPVGGWNGFYYTQSISFSDFYGVEAVTLTGSEAIGSWPTDAFGFNTIPPGSGSQSWGEENHTSQNSTVTATITFTLDETNNRIAIVYSSGNSTQGTSGATGYLTYTDLDVSQGSVWQVKADWSYSTPSTLGGGSFSEPSHSDNTYINMTNGSGRQYQWQVNSGGSPGSATIGSGTVTFYLKNTDGGGTVREVNSGSKTLHLIATHGSQQGVGGGGPE